jgi:hypothetical protein
MGEIKSFGVLRLRTSQNARGAPLRMTILWGETVHEIQIEKAAEAAFLAQPEYLRQHRDVDLLAHLDVVRVVDAVG